MRRNSSTHVLQQHYFVASDDVGLRSETQYLERSSKRQRFRGRLKKTSATGTEAGLSVRPHASLSDESRAVLRQVPTEVPAKSLDARFVRLSQLLELLPVSASTVWRWVRSGRIRAIKLGPRITVFSIEEVVDVFFSEAAR